MYLKIVAISDTHNLIDTLKIPDGDILIHAGDLTGRGSQGEIEKFNQYFKALSHPHKIVIAGNHDFCFEKTPMEAEKILTDCIYLFDSFTMIEGLKIYGSPWSPWFFDWAFNLHRGKEIREKWKLIPDDTDILITHGPPFGILDRNVMNENVGCKDLLDKVQAVQPRLHIFGHIHEAFGEYEYNGTRFINASICTVDYKPVNPPIVYSLDTVLYDIETSYNTS